VDHALLEEWRALLERRASFRETLAPCEPLLEAWADSRQAPEMAKGLEKLGALLVVSFMSWWRASMTRPC
jgi:hypothetical protein